MINHKSIKTATLLLLFILCSNWALAQLGGQQVFQFLNLPGSSRVTALGGTLIAVQDDDVSLAFENPALLDSSAHNALSISHNFHLAGISNGQVNYGRHLKKYGITTHAGIQYINYGDFNFTDEIGNQQGTFSASELALAIGASKRINERIYAGANLKYITATYESYSSNAIATDLGLSYINPESRFVASLVFQNLGLQVSQFANNKETIPLNVQLGVSKKLKHLPFRISVTAQNLQKWNVRYDDPNAQVITDIFGSREEVNSFNQRIDNLFRHFIFSGEFLLGRKENLRIRFGYNHLRRQELKVSQFRSFGGFSLGAGLKIYKFRIDYGVGYYHLAGATNHLTISTNLTEYRKKL